LDIGVLGYIGIVQHKEHSPEVLSIPPGTPCIWKKISILLCYQSLSCVIRRRIATLYTSRASLNLWFRKRWQQKVIHRRLIFLNTSQEV